MPKGKWFAAAKDGGFLDIAITCAAAPDADVCGYVALLRELIETPKPEGE